MLQSTSRHLLIEILEIVETTPPGQYSSEQEREPLPEGYGVADGAARGS